MEENLSKKIEIQRELMRIRGIDKQCRNQRAQFIVVIKQH